jgi:radical SAM protein with 4Fe4S-binding SPASM domain
MCYTITDDFVQHVHRGFMTFYLFKKIIDEIKGKVPAIRLSLRGEPTMHPQFIECIHYAKQAGIKEISTLTNASNLEPEFFEKMMLAGIDWITISLDGLKEEYEKIRMPLKFEDTLRKIKEIKKIKEKYNTHKPVIKIQGIWPALKNNPEEFYNIFEPYVDLIAFNPLIDYLDNDKDIVYEENFSCPQLYQRMVIGSDGKVMPCSNDEMNRIVVGDVNENSVYDIWHGDVLNNMREFHKKENGFIDIELCKLCYLPRKTEDSEVSEVNGRKFIIKNYVGRVQKIGE